MGVNKRLLVWSILWLAAVSSAVSAHAVNKNARYRHRAHYRHVKWDPVLRGSVDSMTRKNEEIDRLQLPRIADQEQLLELERTQELVAIPETQSLRWSSSIQSDKRFARPWPTQFL